MRRPHGGRPRQRSSATRPRRWRPARLPLVAASPAAPRVLGEALAVLPRRPCRRVRSAAASGGHAPRGGVVCRPHGLPPLRRHRHPPGKPRSGDGAKAASTA